MGSTDNDVEVDVEGDDDTSSIGSCSTLTENNSRSGTPTLAPKRKRGRKQLKKKSVPVNPFLPYLYSCHIKEDHGKENYCVQFNNHLGSKDPYIFASAGKNRVTVFECPKGGGIKPLLCFGDPEETECYYTCAWSYNGWRNPLLAVAGFSGIVRVINTYTGKSQSLIGHGSAVNELKFHPKDPLLLLSASKDHTLRLWNVETEVCIAILGSVEGHRDEVLSADFDSEGEKIMSCGIDHALKLWRLDKEDVQKTIAASYHYDRHRADGPFPSYLMHFPDFSTRDVHKNYVDCVRWLGNSVLSKTCDNYVTCWKPGRIDDQTLRLNETKWTLLHNFEYKDNDIWFMRLCLDYEKKSLLVGNKLGRIFMWTLDDDDPSRSRYAELMHPKCTTSVRQISISRDGAVLVASCDDSTLWRWDRNPNAAREEASPER